MILKKIYLLIIVTLFILYTLPAKAIEDIDTLSARFEFDKALTLLNNMKKEEKSATEQIRLMLDFVELKFMQYHFSEGYKLLNSIQDNVEEINTPDIKAKNKLLLSTYEISRNNLHKASDYNTSVLNNKANLNNKNLLAEAYKLKGLINLKKKNINKAISNYKKAILIFEETDNILKRIETQNYLANALIFKGQFDEAATLIDSNIRILEKDNYTYYLINAYLSQITLSMVKGNTAQALEYIEKVKKIAISADSSLHIFQVYTLSGNINEAASQPESALQDYLSAYEALSHIDIVDDATKILLINNIARIYRKRGNTEKALEWLNKTSRFINPELNGEFKQIETNYLLILGDFYKQQQWQNAAEIARLLVDLKTQIFPEDKKNLLETQMNAGFLYEKSKNFQKAIDMYILALQTFNEMKSDDYLQLARLYKTIAANYNELGLYQKALDNYIMAHDTFITHNIKESDEIVNTLNDIATTYTSLHNYTRAQQYYDQALTFVQTHTNNNPVLLARIYNNSGYMEKQRHNIEKAKKNYYKAFKLIENIDQQDLINLKASILNNLGIIYADENSYEKALDLYKASIKLKEKLKDLDIVGYAISSNNIAEVYQNLGQYEKANEYYNKALMIFESTYGQNNLYTGKVYNNLASLNIDFGMFHKALEFAEKSLAIRKKLYPENSYEIAISYNNLATVYYNLFELDKALHYFKIVEEIYEANTDIKDTMRASLYNKIGGILSEQEQHQEALQYHKMALDIFRSSPDKNYIDLLLVYNSLGVTTQYMKDYEKALDYYHKGNEIINKYVKQPSPYTISLYSNISSVYSDTGKLEEALKWANKSLKISKSFDNTYDLANRYYIIAQLYFGLDNFDKALLFAEQSIQQYDNVRYTALSEQDQFYSTTRLQDIYEIAISSAIQKQEYKKALVYTDQAKSALLNRAITSNSNNYKLIMSSEDLKQLNNLQQNYMVNRQRYNEYNKTHIDNSILTDSKLYRIKNEYNTARDNLLKLRQKLETKYPQLENLYNTSNLSVELINELVTKTDFANTAIISYFTGNNNSYAFILAKNRLHVITLNTTNSHIARSLLRFHLPYKLLSQASNQAEFIKALNLFDPENSYDLYKTLFKPVDAYLNEELTPESTQKLIIIPHGFLNYLPFEALTTNNIITGKQNTDIAFEYLKDNPFLIDKYDIQYMNSLQFLPKNNSAQTKQMKTLILANPEIPEMNVPALPELKQLTSLPYAEKEGVAIKNILGKNAQLLTGAAATETAFKENLSNHNIYHIASHGVISNKDPYLSALVLSEDNDNINDGLLHVYELADFSMNMDLITLSACQTALGEYNYGEGINGFTRALVKAGTRNIIVSLWKVNDETTASLMVDFYNNIETKNYSNALREAKLEMKKQVIPVKSKSSAYKAISLAHPYFWAPFILIRGIDQ
jgi:CHAT domain-containing protein